MTKSSPLNVDETKAKQGTERPRRVFVVLAVSMAIAIVAGGILYSIFI